MRKAWALMAFAFTMLTAGAANATAVNWQMGLQEAVTPVMENLHEFHNILLVLITAIVAFVTLLLLWVMIRYNSRTNPVPSKTSHNTLIEVLWTVIPVLILVGIAIPSFRLLYLEMVVPEADMTLKVTAAEWYWDYEYPDNGDIAFSALMKPDEDLAPGEPRLLTTDEKVMVPVDTTVRVLITGGGVIHSWAVPQFGVKMDAIPGRINEAWFRAEKTGTYYGQCSELCGPYHAFMPIEIKVVSKEEFSAWVEEQQAAMQPAEPATQLALAPAAQ